MRLSKTLYLYKTLSHFVLAGQSRR